MQLPNSCDCGMFFLKVSLFIKKNLNFNSNIGVDSKLKGGGAEYYKENIYNRMHFNEIRKRFCVI